MGGETLREGGMSMLDDPAFIAAQQDWVNRTRDEASLAPRSDTLYGYFAERGWRPKAFFMSFDKWSMATTPIN
jgi:hypothetical protein